MFWSKLCMVASCYLPMFPWSGVHSLWFLALGKRDRPEVLSDAQATLNRPTWEQWEYTQMAISMGRLIKTKNIRGTLFSDKTICVMTWFSTEDFQQILPFNDKQNPMEERSEQRTYCETPPRMSCSALLKMQESPSSGRAKNGCLVIWNRVSVFLVYSVNPIEEIELSWSRWWFQTIDVLFPLVGWLIWLIEGFN